MTRKHFIALADHIKRCPDTFTSNQLNTLCRFMHEQNHHFDSSLWLSYIKGECGPNGGKI